MLSVLFNHGRSGLSFVFRRHLFCRQVLKDIAMKFSRNTILFSAIVMGLIVIMYVAQSGAGTGVYDESVVKVIKVIGSVLGLILYGTAGGGANGAE